jgi:type IV pilus assembly protein PilW
MRARGFTLLELLVAMALCLLMTAGSLQLLARGRAAQRVSESVARLEEQARAALEVIGADLRSAGYWGLVAGPVSIEGATPAGGAEPSGLAVAGGCGNSLALDLARPVTAANGRYAVDAGTSLDCPPNSRAVAGTDTLTLRSATPEPTSAAAGRLQVETTVADGRLFADGLPQWPQAARVHDLQVGVYYVASDSTGRRGLPSLRRKRLVGGQRPAFQDEELVAGIGDLQVELGVDSAGDGDHAIEGWHAPDSAPAGWLRAVRVHVLAVADTAETPSIALAALSYADRSLPATTERHRRVLASQTFQLRNAGSAD